MRIKILLSLFKQMYKKLFKLLSMKFSILVQPLFV